MLPNSPEARFLQWLVDHDDMSTTMLPRLPKEIFSARADEYVQLMRKGVAVSIDALPYTDREATEFLQTQLLGLVGRDVARSQKDGRLDRVRASYELLEACQSILDPPPLESYADTVPTVREVIPTGVRPLDQQIQGLSRGELGILAMPPGRGKTTLLINFTVSSLLAGRTVLYISVADQSRQELQPRVDTCLLQEPCPRTATNEDLAERHARAREEMKGELWIADFTDKECTLDDVAKTIRARAADLVIIDHADDITSPYSSDPTVTRHSLRVVYTALKKLARKYDIPVWTASQTHEASWYIRHTGIGDLAEAKVGKTTGASIVLTFSAGPPDQIIPGRMFCSIAKARRNFTERILELHYNHSVMQVW